MPELKPDAAAAPGSYEVLRDRLAQQARALREKAVALNDRRSALFGGAEMGIVGTDRIRTENNCVPRDIVEVGPLLLFGYNVFIGLKSETEVSDVFSLHRFSANDGNFSFEPVAAGSPDDFLAEPRFVADFKELYRYYKDARLMQLRRTSNRLLALFRTGRTSKDMKVFRWSVDPDGRASYVDNRGERDHVVPPAHDFEWTIATRDDHVQGRHPHVSILDQVFVETVGGDLTVKIEDNTEDGRGVYTEPVEEPNQSLDDAAIYYARVGSLILLKILPYKESVFRYLVFNTRTRTVQRIDAIGQACVQLPEDHGLIFPGGYYLQSGESKTFEGNVADMIYLRMLRSPNGEDVLYVFYEHEEGRSILLPYNMIRREVRTPIQCHGYCLFEDGKLVIFRAESNEPTRIHPMQIWQTPFVSDEHAARTPQSGSFLEKIGNADLVRGVSDLLGLCNLIERQSPSLQVYSDLISAAERIRDAYVWMRHDDVGNLAQLIGEIHASGSLVVDEFARVEALRQQAIRAVAEATEKVVELQRTATVSPPDSAERFVASLAEIRTLRGHVIGLRELRYADTERIAAAETQLVELGNDVGKRAVEFLATPDAFEAYRARIGELSGRIDSVERGNDADALAAQLTEIGGGLDVLTETLGSLPIGDATLRTSILESVSEVLSAANHTRALLEAKRRTVRAAEGTAEFGAQFKLFTQNVGSALAFADTPEKCDEQQARLLLQLEDLETRFGELEDFAAQIATKREDVYEAFASKKQALVDTRQRHAQRLVQAADRILDGVARRAAACAGPDELNAYFASDAMVAKVRDIAAQLREVGDSVRSEELESRLKSARQEATRSLRDRKDLFEDGGQLIVLGRHRFAINTRPLELTIVPRGEAMSFHLTGTDYYQPVSDDGFAATKPYWDQILVSENTDVYRAEYLAACLLADAEEGRVQTLDAVRSAVAAGNALDLVRRYAADRYDEGYERGLHDHDAARILEALLPLRDAAGLLRFPPRERALACWFWAQDGDAATRSGWERQARSLSRLRAAFSHHPALHAFAAELGAEIAKLCESQGIAVAEHEAATAGAYLFEELALPVRRFVVSSQAIALRDAFLAHLRSNGGDLEFEADLRELAGRALERFRLAQAWLTAFVDGADQGRLPNAEKVSPLRPEVGEAAVLLLTASVLPREPSNALASGRVEGLLGQHPRIVDRTMALRLDEFLGRLGRFRSERVPGFRKFQEARHRLLERERQRLRLGELQPRVMSSFVRNRLIDGVYLPLIGDNLAKQIGAAGDAKRTDQMGLLLLVSPPGYGKTTLMEYVAHRLGLIFVKVNGPALGHSVTSLDPAEAPHATARQEVERINFALEMGNNVLLYLDDIQHTHPELLQKFISLCDAQRRIEGVWNGVTRTYDLRGKRFAVCMAGNPYTESGERFRIPDMLANRADTYNLGDILEGKDDLFALSYIENALTSSPVLAPLSTREPADVEKLVRMARGEPVSPDQIAHDYSTVELEEVLSVLRKLLKVQALLLKVNQQYILSASQNDAFRSEPRFQLQGSYRNMNKLAARIVPAMNDAELEALIDDHYVNEAQTLTAGAEHNLLKLAELRGRMTDEQRARWEEIKRGFARVQAMGGPEEDPATRVAGQLGLVSERLHGIGESIARAASVAAESGADTSRIEAALAGQLGRLEERIAGLPRTVEFKGAIRALPPDLHALLTKMFETVGESLVPVLRLMGKRLTGYDPSTNAELLKHLEQNAQNIEVLKDLIDKLRGMAVEVTVEDAGAEES